MILHIYIYIYIYIYTHTHIHTHKHLCIHVLWYKHRKRLEGVFQTTNFHNLREQGVANLHVFL